MEGIVLPRHGVRQLLSCWADGPAYITQCPIQTNQSYVHRFQILQQRGTLFWHAHNSWLRASLYGAFIILKKNKTPYPFTNPTQELPPLLIGWINIDVTSLGIYKSIIISHFFKENKNVVFERIMTSSTM